MKKEDKIRKYDSGNRKHNIKKYQEKKSASGKKSGSGPELSVEEKRKIEKDFWKAGNMLYPLPAVMVSCQRPGEKPNIITVAWAATVCSNPAMLSISVRPERYSYDILRETKEFVVNLTTRRLAEATDFCGVCSGREVDKFKKMHLTPGKCEKISAPLIQESPVNIECRVKKSFRLEAMTCF